MMGNKFSLIPIFLTSKIILYAVNIHMGRKNHRHQRNCDDCCGYPLYYGYGGGCGYGYPGGYGYPYYGPYYGYGLGCCGGAYQRFNCRGRNRCV